MTENNDPETSKRVLSAADLMPLKHALDNSKETEQFASKNQVDSISKNCSSLIRVSHTVLPNSKSQKKYNNAIKYFLITSDVPLLPNSASDQAVSEKVEKYFGLSLMKDYLDNMCDNYLSSQMEEQAAQLEEMFGDDKATIEKNLKSFEEQKTAILKKWNEVNTTYFSDCLNEAIKNKTETAQSKAEFAKAVLNLTDKSTDEFDMEKYVDASIHFEYDLMFTEDGSEYLLIQKIKLKVNQNGKLSDEYCFETTSDSEDIQPNGFTEGVFLSQFIVDGVTDKEIDMGTNCSSSLSLDSICTLWFAVIEFRTNPALINMDLKALKEGKNYSQQKAIGHISSEFNIILETISLMFWGIEYNGIRCFTGDNETPVELGSFTPEDYEGKPVVTRFIMSKEAELFSEVQCFIIEPVSNKDTVSFINGFKDYMLVDTDEEPQPTAADLFKIQS